ncbi:hypothetical protein LTR37_008393 [Vermiconidia calcicola]|uniref:Uncharacterized protein n=1 Tax=Vermiconidia calcicola TaxID=1690605 RepID=A0ACC3NAZ0_9PEZI|nr:hypothetical protein LTR37_008393 [Vermiconidia calcicola]
MASDGGTDLGQLIKSMSPTLHPETYVFGTIPAKSEADYSNVLKLFVGFPVQMLFREDEGWTVIVAEKVAQDIQLQSTFPCKKITLNVHSSLDAVGFIAAVGKRLTELGTGVNPVSGYYHDHLFIPVGKEEMVVDALKKMALEQE